MSEKIRTKTITCYLEHVSLWNISVSEKIRTKTITCYLEHVSLWNNGIFWAWEKNVGGGREPENQAGVVHNSLAEWKPPFKSLRSTTGCVVL